MAAASLSCGSTIRGVSHPPENLTLESLPAALLGERPYLFANRTVSIAVETCGRMAAIVEAVERVVTLPAWQAKVGAGETAALPTGVFMGYDFHLTPQGPQLIEINTNAGGGLLAALQADRADVLADYVDMFRTERAGRPLAMLAIVDDMPQHQYLYPEFLAFQRLFAGHGIQAVICDPADLTLCHGGLWYGESRIDLVYNRLTDFAFTDPRHAALREGWLAGDVTVTPNPAVYARYADKRNLVWLTDRAWLADSGVPVQICATLLAGIPLTERVTNARGDEFWARRRELFFKPATGFGSKGSYRGDKLTKRVFAEILAGDYVAQQLAAPSTVGEGEDALKVDVRNYVYQGRVQLVAARLYQGQTTNFRTPGGGFAKVIAT